MYYYVTFYFCLIFEIDVKVCKLFLYEISTFIFYIQLEWLVLYKFNNVSAKFLIDIENWKIIYSFFVQILCYLNDGSVILWQDGAKERKRFVRHTTCFTEAVFHKEFKTNLFGISKQSLTKTANIVLSNH